jgi:hypothetical protein
VQTICGKLFNNLQQQHHNASNNQYTTSMQRVIANNITVEVLAWQRPKMLHGQLQRKEHLSAMLIRQYSQSIILCSFNQTSG